MDWKWVKISNLEKHKLVSIKKNLGIKEKKSINQSESIRN